MLPLLRLCYTFAYKQGFSDYTYCIDLINYSPCSYQLTYHQWLRYVAIQFEETFTNKTPPLPRTFLRTHTVCSPASVMPLTHSVNRTTIHNDASTIYALQFFQCNAKFVMWNWAVGNDSSRLVYCDYISRNPFCSIERTVLNLFLNFFIFIYPIIIFFGLQCRSV